MFLLFGQRDSLLIQLVYDLMLVDAGYFPIPLPTFKLIVYSLLQYDLKHLFTVYFESLNILLKPYDLNVRGSSRK